jgi:hypothetical protein
MSSLATYFWSADTEDGYHGTVNLALTFGSDSRCSMPTITETTWCAV